MRNALHLAMEQGSNYYVASAGYRLAYQVRKEVTAKSGALDPPSTVLGWLAQAEAAHRKCQGILPASWTRQLDYLRSLGLSLKDWLEQLDKEGEYRPPTAEELKSIADIHNDAMSKFRESPLAVFECDGCDKFAAQLRSCGSCKEAKYCR